jgi:hypothetical protein
VNRALAERAYEHLYPTVLELRKQGMSLQAIADELTRRGERTRYMQGPLNKMQVSRIIDRAEAALGPVTGQ